MADNRKTPEQLASEQRKKWVDYYHTFTLPAGKAVLDDLREQFMDRSSIVPGDPHATHAREGAREVYLYIQQMIEEGANHHE
jgi:hypothetical protein